MKKAIKKLWVNALRSGEYQKSKYALRTNAGFCCLGVLCDLHRKKVMKKAVEKAWSYSTTDKVFTYSSAYSTLPDNVATWAGLGTRNPVINDRALSEWNDSFDKSFSEIATQISEYL